MIEWSQIQDMIVYKVFMRHSGKIGPIFEGSSPNIYGELEEIGTIRIILKDGRQIEIKNVLTPFTVVDYIKKVYLKK
ncbi:hypothetical protein SJAV_08610 [Sulfurisphaera javensis]|uniref:Uncharacterized protein n=1 Tax=Sulfurisphaera javensis TaxID=2049879 RepID=A0AAT9GQ01_9CREN